MRELSNDPIITALFTDIKYYSLPHKILVKVHKGQSCFIFV